MSASSHVVTVAECASQSSTHHVFFSSTETNIETQHSRAVIKLEDHSLSHLIHRDKSVIFKDPVAACFVRLRHYSYTHINMDEESVLNLGLKLNSCSSFTRFQLTCTYLEGK